MTYDELLTKIKTGNEFAGIKYASDSHTFARRAVVELHKPEFVEVIQDLGCMACRHGSPCPTIQAIEKELS